MAGQQYTIKPLKSIYKGYQFASKLEAQWATFFDLMGIPFDYESQGWEVATGVWYTPDFTLERCYVEIKHLNYDDDDVTEKMGLLVAGIRVPGVIIYGDPYEHIAVLYEPSYMLECGYVRHVASFLNLYGAVGAAIKARQARFDREPAQ